MILPWQWCYHDFTMVLRSIRCISSSGWDCDNGGRPSGPTGFLSGCRSGGGWLGSTELAMGPYPGAMGGDVSPGAWFVPDISNIFLPFSTLLLLAWKIGSHLKIGRTQRSLERRQCPTSASKVWSLGAGRIAIAKTRGSWWFGSSMTTTSLWRCCSCWIHWEPTASMEASSHRPIRSHHIASPLK